MRRPTVGLVVAFNRAIRADDEWFDEPDDLPRVAAALRAVQDINVEADVVALFQSRA